MSQKDQILEYLKNGNTITHRECEDLFNCSRVAARIDDLKKEGHPVDSIMIKTRTGKHVAQYFYEAPTDLYPDRMPHHTEVL